MNKPTQKKINIDQLIVNKELNVRLVDNYDLPALKEQIVNMGRVIKPIIIEGETNEVLSGNRRVLACKELKEDPKCPIELFKEIEKLDCIVYTGLTDAERLQLVFDHGSEKTINRTETLLSVWRLDKQMFSEKAIASMMYYALAKYTGNEKKLKDVPLEPAAREKYVYGWFRGTLGNYMLAAHRMGEYVRTQMVLTHLAEDKMLKEEEHVECKMSRDRITALSAAKTVDQGKDGKGWSADTGGENFNAKIEEFKLEDKGQKAPKVERPSAKVLKGMADVYKSPSIRRALLVAAGDESVDAKQLMEDDERLAAFNEKMASLAKHAKSIKDPEVKTFVETLLAGSPADIEKMLQALTK